MVTELYLLHICLLRLPALMHATCCKKPKQVWPLFLVGLQGIALTSDPNYKVLAAAYPWIARRLLTNQTPELRDTLHALLYKNNQFQVRDPPPITIIQPPGG